MAHKRRGRGEGSIYQRADGLYVSSVSLGYDGNGKRRRKAVYGKTKAEVLEKLAQLKQGGAALPTDRLRLAEYLTWWLETIVRPDRSRNTYRSYEGMTRLYIGPAIRGTRLDQLTSDHIQGLYAAMKKAGASDRLRQLAHAVLHRALQTAVESKPPKLPFNPCDYVEAPRLPAAKVHRVEPYSAEQVQALLAASAGHRLGALIVLAVFTGLRQGELSLAVNALWDHRARMLAEGHLAGPVFCDTHGGWLRKSNFLRNVFRPLIETAGLPRRRFHDLRHTSATLLLTLGVHPKVVQERLGHSKINVTLDTYSHVAPTLQKEAAAKLDGLFRKFG
jgi:integrase